MTTELKHTMIAMALILCGAYTIAADIPATHVFSNGLMLYKANEFAVSGTDIQAFAKNGHYTASNQ